MGEVLSLVPTPLDICGCSGVGLSGEKPFDLLPGRGESVLVDRAFASSKREPHLNPFCCSMDARSQFLLSLLLGFTLWSGPGIPCALAVDPQAPTLGLIPDQSTSQGVPLEISLEVRDADTPSSGLALSAAADNTALLPAGSLRISGGLVSPRLEIRPAITQRGVSEITVVARDSDGLSAVRQFRLTVTARNVPPETTGIPDQSIRENESTSELKFFVADEESSFESLKLSGQSSNPVLVPSSAFVFAGAGFQRSVVIRPAPGQSGEAELAVLVTDPDGGTTPIRFKLRVIPIHQKPTVSEVLDVTLESTTGAVVAIPFTVGDPDSPLEKLKVSAQSSDPSFLPNGALRLDGEGAHRVLRIEPRAGRAGSSRIELTVRDDRDATVSTSFEFRVLLDAENAVPADFNGDGFPDIVLEDRDGFLACAFLQDRFLVGSAFFDPSHIGDRAWRLINTADFNQDRKPDLLFQHRDGDLAAWTMDGVRMKGVLNFSPARHNEPGWFLITMADIYGDGTRDFFFQHADGRLSAWLMNGTTLSASASLNPGAVQDARWRLVGSSYLNSDGHPDLLFQHQDGTLGYWKLSGLRLIEPGLLQPSHPGSGWRVVVVQDFDQDGTRDLMFQHDDGSLGIWYLKGTTLREAHFVDPSNPGIHWRVAGPR